MKKIFLLVSILTVIFLACEEEPEEIITQMTISNETTNFIYRDIKWNGTEFRTRRYPQSSNSITIWDNHINPGYSMTCSVKPGTGYIYFKYGTDINNLISAKTSEVIVVEKGKDYFFTFTKNTIYE